MIHVFIYWFLPGHAPCKNTITRVRYLNAAAKPHHSAELFWLEEPKTLQGLFRESDYFDISLERSMQACMPDMTLPRIPVRSSSITARMVVPQGEQTISFRSPG